MKRLDLLGVLFWVLGALYVAGALVVAVVGTLGGLGILDPSDALDERVGGAVGAADILCCCNAPLGTALGIFALVVLLSDEVVRLFPGPG
jgi:hypothetical protein